MKAYILCIVLVTIINFINEFLLNKKNSKSNIILYLLSLFLICFIAGSRSITVGRDIGTYVIRLANLTTTSNGIIDYLINSNSDFLFALLNYIGYIFKDYHVLLFVIELAVAFPVYIYAYLNRDKVPYTITILIFLLTMFCQSLNVMRQSIAISLSLLSYYFFNKNDKKKSYLILIVAFLFHKSAFITILIFLFDKVIRRYKGNILYIILFILALIAVTPIASNIIEHTIYSSYVGNTLFMKNFSLGSIVKRLIFVFMWLLCLSKSKDNNFYKESLIGLLISIFSLYCTILSFSIPGMGRLGYYFYDISCFLIVYKLPFLFKQRKLIYFLVLTLYVILWWNMTAVDNDSSEVYPYKSDVLNFLN